MHGIFDALISAATADVARHRFAYLVLAGLWIFGEERYGLHDLADLAIAALRDIDLTPGLLDRVISSWMKSLDRRDLAADHVGNRRDAGARCLLVDDHRAGAAKGLAAAEFCARQSGFVTQVPKQWKVGIAIPVLLLAVNFQRNHDRSSLFISC